MFGYFKRSKADLKSELLEILADTRRMLALAENDFSWSSWEDAASALQELDNLTKEIADSEKPNFQTLDILFLPTGPVQEVSVSSGWGKKFLKLAARFDRVQSKYGE